MFLRHKIFTLIFLLCLSLTPALGICQLAQTINHGSSGIFWDKPRSNTHAGQLLKYRFKSPLLSNRRDIWVYVPYQYSAQHNSYPLLLVFDGQAYVSDLIPSPIILDNLIHEKAIPPVIAVFISSIDQKTRNQELPCHRPFADFLALELLPWIRSHYHVTTDPQQTIVAGSSYGGLAAAYAAWTYPNYFGHVLSQSGAFWWKPKEDKKDQWLIKQLAESPAISVRFYLDVGKEECESFADCHSMLTVNRNLSKTLKAKGCVVHYQEFDGGHQYECWRRTFAHGLMALIGNPVESTSKPLN